ncbi:MAG: hypothetical protein ACM35G_03805, partial [Planctomycetaceae bacterium]
LGMSLAISLGCLRFPISLPITSEVTIMNAKQRRKVHGVRREHRRPRGWTRWFREGLLEAEPVMGGVRLRTTLWGLPGT